MLKKLRAGANGIARLVVGSGRAAPLLVAAFALALAGCGGGGGGGGGGLPGLPVGAGNPNVADNFTTVNVAIASVTPASIDADLYEGALMTNVTLIGTAVGDLNVLNGRTLYVIVEDPDGLFAPNPQAGITSGASPSAVVVLQGRNLNTAGTYSGQLRVFACLDPQCGVRLGNVPYQIPYNVRVRRNTALDKDVLQLSSVYGQTPPVGSVRVTPPEGFPVSSLSVSRIFQSTNDLQAETTLSDNGDGTATLQVKPPPMLLPGGHSAQLSIDWNTPSPDWNGPYPTVRKTLQVDYQVNLDAGTPYVFDPAMLELSVRPDGMAGSQSFHGYDDGSGLAYQGWEFLFTPEQLDAIPANFRTGFISITNDDGSTADAAPTYRSNLTIHYSSCHLVADSSLCLDPGTYLFQVNYLRHVGSTTMPVHYMGRLVVAY